jgi:hypothetical protein
MGMCESCYREIDVPYYLGEDEICEDCYLKIVGYYDEDEDDDFDDIDDCSCDICGCNNTDYCQCYDE